MKTKVSFDFDGCLAEIPELQSMAKRMSAGGMDVFILTSRCKETANIDLEKIALLCWIPKKRIIYACMGDKWRAMDRHRITMHFDDDSVEVDIINENLPGRAVLVNYRRHG